MRVIIDLWYSVGTLESCIVYLVVSYKPWTSVPTLATLYCAPHYFTVYQTTVARVNWENFRFGRPSREQNTIGGPKRKSAFFTLLRLQKPYTATMGKKAAKSMKKFASSGQLKKTIDARRKHQQIKRKNLSKKSVKDGKAKQRPESGQQEDEEDEDEPSSSKAPKKG